MITYHVEKGDASCVIYAKAGDKPGLIHSQVFALFNPHFERDAERIAEGLNDFSARARAWLDSHAYDAERVVADAENQ